MDKDGFVYFKGRLKRMIITSGYCVYPGMIENVIDSHPSVKMSCVIGIPHPYKVTVAKAFIVLKKDTKEIITYLMSKDINDVEDIDVQRIGYFNFISTSNSDSSFSDFSAPRYCASTIEHPVPITEKRIVRKKEYCETRPTAATASLL